MTGRPSPRPQGPEAPRPRPFMQEIYTVVLRAHTSSHNVATKNLFLVLGVPGSSSRPPSSAPARLQGSNPRLQGSQGPWRPQSARCSSSASSSRGPRPRVFPSRSSRIPLPPAAGVSLFSAPRPHGPCRTRTPWTPASPTTGDPLRAGSGSRSRAAGPVAEERRARRCARRRCRVPCNEAMPRSAMAQRSGQGQGGEKEEDSSFRPACAERRARPPRPP